MTKRLGSLAQIVAALGLGMLFGLWALVLALVTGVQFGTAPLLLLLPGALLLYGFVLLLHESGHLLAGLAVGMRIREVVVGPVCVFPRAGTLGVRFLNPMIW